MRMGLTRCTIVHTIEPAGFEWDAAKAALNFRKHNVDFAEAVSVFEDEMALTIRDPDSEREDRFVTLGHDARLRLLVVVYTWRAERIRLISAREATGRERHRYGAKR